jgi:hypothetical protein
MWSAKIPLHLKEIEVIYGGRIGPAMPAQEALGNPIGQRDDIEFEKDVLRTSTD